MFMLMLPDMFFDHASDKSLLRVRAASRQKHVFVLFVFVQVVSVSKITIFFIFMILKVERHNYTGHTRGDNDFSQKHRKVDKKKNKS